MGLSFEAATTWSLHPWRLVELIWPEAFGDPFQAATNLNALLEPAGQDAVARSWSLSLFLGAPVVGLGALAGVTARKGARGLLLAAGLLTVLVLGSHTPL